MKRDGRIILARTTYLFLEFFVSVAHFGPYSTACTRRFNARYLSKSVHAKIRLAPRPEGTTSFWKKLQLTEEMLSSHKKNFPDTVNAYAVWYVYLFV
jgi:hypothetical protein